MNKKSAYTCSGKQCSLTLSLNKPNLAKITDDSTKQQLASTFCVTRKDQDPEKQFQQSLIPKKLRISLLHEQQKQQILQEVHEVSFNKNVTYNWKEQVIKEMYKMENSKQAKNYHTKIEDLLKLKEQAKCPCPLNKCPCVECLYKRKDGMLTTDDSSASIEECAANKASSTKKLLPSLPPLLQFNEPLQEKPKSNEKDKEECIANKTIIKNTMQANVKEDKRYSKKKQQTYKICMCEDVDFESSSNYDNDNERSYKLNSDSSFDSLLEFGTKNRRTPSQKEFVTNIEVCVPSKFMNNVQLIPNPCSTEYDDICSANNKRHKNKNTKCAANEYYDNLVVVDVMKNKDKDRDKGKGKDKDKDEGEVSRDNDGNDDNLKNSKHKDFKDIIADALNSGFIEEEKITKKHYAPLMSQNVDVETPEKESSHLVADLVVSEKKSIEEDLIVAKSRGRKIQNIQGEDNVEDKDKEKMKEVVSALTKDEQDRELDTTKKRIAKRRTLIIPKPRVGKIPVKEKHVPPKRRDNSKHVFPPTEHHDLFGYKMRGASVYSKLSFHPYIIYKYYPTYKYGERGSGFKSKGESQDYYKLRDYHYENGTLFEDQEFPADNSSLFYSERPTRRYEWLRPGEICDNPQLFVEGYSRFDVQQGELGDCWLLAAVANLTLHKRLFFQIVPDDQGFDEKYAGIFHFRFWQYGKWIDIVIDDRLPTYKGNLIYLHSTEPNEFWSALLEKAYAKLHGSYEALKGGSTCEAMEDFTGGVTEMYELDATPPNLFKIVLKAHERCSLMGCSLEPDPNVLEAETPEGLIRGHAYSITRVKYVDIRTPNTTGKIPLLRLRNPWGNESEWNGAWSDKSPEWRYIPEEEKQELGLTFDNDGEFWMSYKDFSMHFNRIEICNLNPDSLTEEELEDGKKKQWEVSFFEGEWVKGVTAGGCRNFLDTFWHNPQYRITLTEVDEDDDDGKCTVIIALMQKNRRQQRNIGLDTMTIGYAIYHLPYPDRAPKPLDMSYFKYNASVARSPSFINLREVSCRFKLPPGTYCIVPSTFEPNEEGEFLLRVFSEHKNHMEYVGDDPQPYSRPNRSISYNRDDEDEDENHTPSYPPYNRPSYPSNPSYPYNPGYPPQPSSGGAGGFFGGGGGGGGGFDFQPLLNFFSSNFSAAPGSQTPQTPQNNPPYPTDNANPPYPAPSYPQPPGYPYPQPNNAAPPYPPASGGYPYPQPPQQGGYPYPQPPYPTQPQPPQQPGDYPRQQYYPPPNYRY